MDIDFDQERRWWDAKAAEEETDMADEPINRALRWREIERRLDAVKTILDVGGGTGAFSVPLAKRGFDVTHLDLSPEMLKIARQKTGGLDNIRFVQGNATDLTAFEDRSFDLVLATDGAVSFSGSEAETAIRECCRVARRWVIMTVFQRAQEVALFLAACLQEQSEITRTVHGLMDNGLWHRDRFPEDAWLAASCTNGYLGTFQSFLPSQLSRIIGSTGLRVRRVGGLGSLAWLCGPETVRRVLDNHRLFDQFVDLCDRFDHEILPEGPGTLVRSGLIAVAQRCS